MNRLSATPDRGEAPHHPRRGHRLTAILFVVTAALLAGLFPRATAAAELTQYFPAVPEGVSQPAPESGWRIRWQVLEPGTHTYGGSAILEFQSIEFMKGRRPDGSEDWIKILNNLALAEMYVPYNSGQAFLDISQFNFSLIPARPDYLPRYGVVRAKIEDTYVISEVVDDGVRWLDNNDNFRIQRGQAIKLWTNLHAANYTYTMVYTFHDDGKISVRVGGTAQNLVNVTQDHATHNNATHVHMGAWRMEFDLGNASANTVDVIERATDPTTGVGSIDHKPFNGNREGGFKWDPGRFTTLKITNGRTLNRHDPPRNVSYMLNTRKAGQLRTAQAFTAQDFWVTRLVPDAPARRAQAPELRFVDLTENIANPEPTEGRPIVLWHTAGLQHMPHGEDFGPRGFNAEEGAAINYFIGFDLVPVDLWHQTPFLDRSRPLVVASAATPAAGTAVRSAMAAPATAPAAPRPTDAVTSRPKLRRGAQGDIVSELQKKLVVKGYKVEVDGRYGRGTRNAVRDLQRASSVAADGVVGEATWKLLDDIKL